MKTPIPSQRPTFETDRRKSDTEKSASEGAPDPKRDSAVERALAVAENMGPKTSRHSSHPAGAEGLKDSPSLKKVIDQVEERLTSYLRTSGRSDQSLPEELDNLDIGVELGRPDDSSEVMYDSANQSGVGYGEKGAYRAGTRDSYTPSRTPEEEQTAPEDDPPDTEDSEWSEEEIEERMADSLSPFGSRRWSQPPELPGLNIAQGFVERRDGDADDRPLDSGVVSVDSEPSTVSEYEDTAVRRYTSPPGSVAEAREEPPEESIRDHEGGLRLDRGHRMYGDLKQDRLWTLLLAVCVERRTGSLLLINGNVERRIFVDAGDVVAATSSAREDRLTELLYREGRLNDDEYQQAVRAVGISGRRAGAILVERGLIASRELYPVVRHHYEHIIMDTFAWRRGSWNFEPDATLENERILLDTPTPALVVEGVRSRLGADELRHIAPNDARPRKTAGGLCEIEDLGLLPEEVSVYELCDGHSTLEELADRFTVELRELSGFVAGLQVLGLLEYDQRGAEILQRGGERTSQRAAPHRDYRVERARVMDKLQQVNEASYFALLEVAPDASGYEIRKAFRDQKARYQAERFAVRELIDLHEETRLIRQILDEAYEVLRNPTTRELYRQYAGDQFSGS